jgi:hypothetical protein
MFRSYSSHVEVPSAIEWLCRIKKQDKNKWDMFAIPAVKKVITNMWDRFGKPRVIHSAATSALVTCLLTIILGTKYYILLMNIFSNSGVGL